jgi:hypothetical protein
MKRVGEASSRYSETLRAALGRAELRTIRDAYDVGRAIVEEFYGGVDAFRSRSSGTGSVRDLAEYSGGKLSAATLWRAASTYVLVQRAPELLDSPFLRLSHVYAVLDLPPERQLDLLLRAERLRWTSDRLRDESPKGTPRKRSGERASYVTSLHSALNRIVSMPRPHRENLTPQAAAALLTLLDAAQERIDALRDWLESDPAMKDDD